MEIKEPKPFEVNDKAHANLFNDMVEVLLENDSGLLEQINDHMDDANPHASVAEKKKWNESQLYKITADNGMQLINVPVGSTIFDAIKDKGTCTFYAQPGIEDSPAPNNSALRGIQSVGQANIGTGLAIDTAGNAYYFYYNSDQISITWTQLPTAAEKDKWNNGQLYRLTPNNGRIARVPNGTDIFTLSTGPYMGAQLLNAPVENDLSFYYIDVLETAYEQNEVIYKRIIATRSFDNVTWIGTFHAQGFRGWKRVLSDVDATVQWFTPTLSNGWKQYVSSEGFSHTLRYSKDALGVVELIGSIYGGTLGNDIPAFTLPAEYRPLQSTHLIGVASSVGTSGVPQYHRTYIGTDGRVCIQSSSNTANPAEFITFGFRFKSA
ncbi:hypothetical protein WAX46_05760 [Bacillus sp. FJAT-53060]|uniref:hypothetical protein n=1 Tax=Bacillus sp. FJAT-53060 TaxID=3127666 RepID=UPI003013434A